MRGRKPVPTHLKLVTGNPGKRAIKKDAAFDAKVPRSGVPMPPAELCDEAKVEWGRVAVALHRMGLLTDLDTAVLAAYCQAYGVWIQAERAVRKMALADTVTNGLLIKTKSGNAIQNPLVGVANKAKADMVKYAAEFGMSPSARSRISAKAADSEEDKTAKYF